MNTTAGQRLLVSMGAVTLGIVMAQSAPAAGAERPAAGPPYEQLINANSRKCADVPGFSTQDKTRVEQYTCNGGANQRWTFRYLGDLLYTVSNVNSGKCLDVPGFSSQDKTAIEQYPCNGGTNQQWRLRPLGNGYWEMVNVSSGKCLDVPGFSTQDKTVLEQYTCNAGTNQQWTLI
ncbi:RICIN domain-containing protein [Streptomyces sp. NPDC052396]|uniref:RICIN domain-containing protein n=1 Tax=Streptomyces sp. NPDC052396 TaxID=3365689 RepID=UPI0037CFEA06